MFKMNMSKVFRYAILLLLTGLNAAFADTPKAMHTEILGPFTGDQAPLHPDNLAPRRIRYYGTDLGFTYEHKGQLKILFGDTMATEEGEKIEASSGDRLDDSFGSIDLSAWPDPGRIRPGNLPLIKLGQNPGTDEMSAIDPGHAMEGFKTPVGGFSNGRDEYGIFYLGKPQGCSADQDCSNGLSCDQGLGYVGVPFSIDEGPTFGCVDGSSPACHPDTVITELGAAVANSGFCIDKGSSIWSPGDFGRVNAIGVKLLVGLRDKQKPKLYGHTREWLTNRFLNVAVRTVNQFDPARGGDFKQQDFRPASGAGKDQRVFLWGRPAFIGVKKKGRTAGLYFAYVDMPAGKDYQWKPHYYTGNNQDGLAQFSLEETKAVAIDLDSSREGNQPEEQHDIVDQVSIAWVERLQKWVMFYGGGFTRLPYLPSLPICGILELFTGPDCVHVQIGNGAFRMRTADNPWGPWSPPQDLIAGGDPKIPGSGQYGPGGMLHHTACVGDDCAPHTSARDASKNEYGFFYSANIIEQWTRPAGDGVEIIWNASTWDPYRVILLRTRIDP